MFLVRLIDVFVGILEFVFKSDKRSQGASPAVLGTAGVITLVVLMVGALGFPAIMYHSRTSSYFAELANAGGLTTSDPVLVSGVPAGRIESIELAGDRVRVEFRLDNKQPLGNQTRAGVRLRTVLGKRYFDLVPGGSGEVGPNNTIPLNRTESPYSLDDVSTDLVSSTSEIDPTVVKAMMSTMQKMVPDSGDLSSAMDGVSGAALAVSGTGAQLDNLLAIAKRLATVTSEQSDSIATAFGNTQVLVQTLVVRKRVMTQLADNLRLVLKTMADTFPTIPLGDLADNLVDVTDTLSANVGNIERVLQTLPPAMRTIVDASGNGNWVDVVSPSAVLPDNLLCAMAVMQECG